MIEEAKNALRTIKISYSESLKADLWIFWYHDFCESHIHLNLIFLEYIEEMAEKSQWKILNVT